MDCAVPRWIACPDVEGGLVVLEQFATEARKDPYWLKEQEPEKERARESSLPVQESVVSLACLPCARLRGPVPFLRLRPLAHMFPNLQTLSLTDCWGNWAGARFDRLTEVHVSENDYATENLEALLVGHRGQIQRMHIRRRSGFLISRGYKLSPGVRLARELETVPALRCSLYQLPAELVLSTTRTELQVATVEESTLRDWGVYLGMHMHRAEFNRLHTLRLELDAPFHDTHLLPDVESNWEDLETILLSVGRTLNTLQIDDRDALLGVPNPRRLARTLVFTRVTELRISHGYRVSGKVLAAHLAALLTDLCRVSIAQLQAPVYTDGPAEVECITPGATRRDGWGYVCVALAFLRANQANSLKRCYVPLIPEVVALAGWADAHGGQAFFAKKQQDFCDRLYSLTGAAPAAAAAAATSTPSCCVIS